MTNDVCVREGHDLTVHEDVACKVCGMPHDEAMRDMGFQEREGRWMIEFPADQPIEFRERW